PGDEPTDRPGGTQPTTQLGPSRVAELLDDPLGVHAGSAEPLDELAGDRTDTALDVVEQRGLPGPERWELRPTPHGRQPRPRRLLVRLLELGVPSFEGRPLGERSREADVSEQVEQLDGVDLHG